MRLIVQIQTVVNQLVEIDLRGTIEAPVTAAVTGTPIAMGPVATSLTASFTAGTWRPISPIPAIPIPWLLSCLLFRHLDPA
ncbi:MAG TPA: hypothetical protein VHY84_13720 [Bryobacteraceae bacterium]|nr:hypothetical protein [Bryobacteraceae bacterium]